MEIVNKILKQMSNISKPQQKFIIVLFATLLLFRGRANFRNLSRYSALCEKTYSRQFRKTFDFVKFNRLATSDTIPKSHTQIAAIDCSFINKSGKHTYGLDKFYNSKIDKSAKGLEIFTISITDWYRKHLEQDRYAIWPTVRYLAHDGYYQKVKFVDGVVGLGLHSVVKLGCDSNDIHLNATEIYRFYKARFQIEFLLRNAKQFTGLINYVTVGA